MTEAPTTSEQPLAERIGSRQAPRIPQRTDAITWRTAERGDIDALHSVMAAADRVDHPSWTTPREEVADTFDLSHVDHGRDTIVAFAADGTPVAMGSAFLHPSRDGWLRVDLHGAVHPAWRRRGIGAEVFAWQHARALEQLAESGSSLPAEVHVHADEGDDGAVVLAERHGYVTERWFASMARDMAMPLPDLPPVDGIAFAPFTRERTEDARLARNDAFRDHWGSAPSDPERWEKFLGGSFFRPDLSMLALDDGRVVAFCLASVNEDDWGSLGASHAYIDLIGVVRSHRGRGLAPRVIARSLRAIADAGLEQAVLDVDTESPTGANSLYERLGFAATERSRVLVRRY